MSTHLSTLTLHQLRYGELLGEVESNARAHLAECDLCAERMGAQHAERAAFEALPVPQAVQDAARAPVPANDNRAWLRAVSLLAAVAAILLVIIAQPWQTETELHPGIRPKGHGAASVVQAFRDGNTGPVPLVSGSAVSPGDRIQLQVRRPPAPWVTVAGVDGAGQADVYGSWQPRSQEWEPAPFGLTLDDTMGEERLYIVFTDTEPNRAALREALSSGAPPYGTEWEVIVLDKTR